MSKLLPKKFANFGTKSWREEEERLRFLLRYWEQLKKAFPENSSYFQWEIRRVKEKMEKIDCQISK